MNKSLAFISSIIAFFVNVSCSHLFHNEISFDDVTAVQDENGHITIIGFATNISDHFITMATISVSVLLKDGNTFTPSSYYAIDVYAKPGERIPFHTGGEDVPEYKSVKTISLIDTDPIRDPDFWNHQAEMRKEIKVTNISSHKEGASLGFSGRVISAIPNLSTTHVVFACYDSSGKLHDVQSWTLEPNIDSSASDGFEFLTGSSGTDRSPAPSKVEGFVQHFETTSIKRPDSVATEPSIK